MHCLDQLDNGFCVNISKNDTFFHEESWNKSNIKKCVPKKYKGYFGPAKVCCHQYLYIL